MADTIPVPYEISAADAASLSGTTDPDTGVPFVPAGANASSSPSLLVQLYRIQRLLANMLDTTGRAIRTSGGQLHIGVYPFDVPYADGNVYRFEGATGYELSGGDATYKVWISRATTTPTLSHGAAWPASKDDYIPLAEYVVSGGVITTSDKDADMRSLAMFEGFHAATAGTGTTATSFVLDSDNAGAGVDSALKFNRGSTAADAQLEWNETNDRFELEAEEAGPTLATINLLSVLVSGTAMLDANGAAKVAAAVAGDGLDHAAGVLSVIVDDSTIEINSDTLRLKDGGITTAKLGNTLADKLVQISIGDASGASPQTITIQAKDIQGNNLAEVIYLEVGVFDDADGETEATNATIADGGAGSFLDAITADKRYRAKTDSSGTLEVAVTDGTAETVYILAAATRRSRIMDCADIGTVVIS
jgi:hypothetical protein